MLIAVERLLIRTRHTASRADELIAVRARLRAERAAAATEAERTAAHAVRELKATVSATLAEVRSCTTCADGKPLPRGEFTGGDCCAGVTADLFSDDEVAALAHAGTRPRDLQAPRDAHAGCAFRGERGCTLRAVDRPERCVSYMCNVLRRELRSRSELAHVDALVADLRAAMVRFTELHRTRIDDEILAPLETYLDGR